MAVHLQSLDILSICTGGGGLDLGIELAVPGARSVVLVEREAFAVAHLVAAMEQGLMAPAPVWSDARTFDGRRWRGCVDGLIGGIPCQPHSLAGRKQGQLDERDLWSDARRIIVQSRCWFVLIENVGGMLSAGADEIAGAERVWRDLRKLGFAVEVGLFTAAEVGASHERERVFILGVADCDDAGLEGYGRSVERPGEWPAGQGGGELADAANRRRDNRPTSGECDGRSRPAGRCGGALVDAALVRPGEGRPEPSLRSGRDAIAGAGRPMDHAVSRGWPAGRDDHGSNVGLQPDATGQHHLGNAIGRGHDRRSNDAIGCSIERTVAQGPVGTPVLFPPGPDHLSRWADVLASSPELEPAFRRVADGLASRLDIGRVDRLRMLGNGVVPLQAAHAFRTLCHRLAGRGSAGAARLVRMMEVA